MSYRFQNYAESKKKTESQKAAPQKRTYSESVRQKARKQEIENDIAYKLFIKLREAANEHIYKFFQYKLYNLARRDEVYNRGIFDRIVYGIRKSYHEIGLLEELADEPELLEHFSVFKKMIFDFYRASECLNINDNYTNQYDVNAYRAYRRGDEKLTDAMKEIFFERHNRGFFKRQLAVVNLMDAQLFLKNAIQSFPKSSWAVEIRIKLEFTESLINYFRLFFSK